MIGEAAEEYYSKIGFPENAGIDGTEVAPWVGTRESLGESRTTPIIVHFLRNQSQRTHVCRRNTDHPTHPAYACSSFLFYNLCGPEKAASALPHSAPCGSN